MQAPGTLFDGRYRVERELGRGAAAQVLLARDTQLDRPVAIKWLTAGGTLADPRRLVAEARTLARLAHPAVVPVYDAGQVQGRAYLALAYLAGGSLEERLTAGPLGVAEAGRHASRVADALAAAHRAGLVHRDVKVANVLLDGDGLAYLGDFGLVRDQAQAGPTQTGMVVGTPVAMAPEVFGGEPATPASDVYAWGVMLYQLLTGHPPYQGELAAIRFAASEGRAPAPVPGPLGRLVLDCLAPRQGDRPPSATLARRVLELSRRPPTGPGAAPGADSTLSLSEEAPRARLRGFRTRPTSARPRGRWRGALGSLGLVAVLGVAGVLATRDRSAPAKARDPRAQALASALRTVEAWQARARRVDPRGWVEGELDALGARVGRDVQRSMYFSRVDPGWQPEVRARLVAGVAGVPHRAALRAEAPALGALLADDEVPGEVRDRLAAALEVFAHLDAWAEAWGIPPPYGTRELLDAWVPVDEFPYEAGWAEVAAVPEGPVAPGAYALQRWGPRVHQENWLLLPPGEGEGYKSAGIGLSRLMLEMQPADHQRLAGTVDLGAEGPRREVHVVFSTHRTSLPNALRVEVGDRARVYRPSPVWGGLFDTLKAVEMVVTVRVPVPAWWLRPGKNLIAVRHQPLPGLVGADPVGVNHLGVEVGAPGLRSGTVAP